MSNSYSIDNGITWLPMPDNLRVIISNLDIPGEDDPHGELHFNFTTEGLILDVWCDRGEEENHNAGTSSEMYQGIVDRLVEDNA